MGSEAQPFLKTVDTTIPSVCLPCVTCDRPMREVEVWPGQLCEQCALARAPGACRTCKDTGERWGYRKDKWGQMKPAIVACECLGGQKS